MESYNFTHVFDLQNSNRTSFYKRILFPKASKDVWSSTETTLPDGTTKEDFDRLCDALIKVKKIFGDS